MNTRLEVEALGFAYDRCPVLDGVSFQASAGDLIAIAGPNGTGKSTLAGVCAGLRTPYSGACRFEGREVREWKRRDLARQVAFLPQTLRIEFPFTAAQVVLMGRAPYGDGLFESEADLRIAEEALRKTDAFQFRERDFRTLSGGEQQRVILASALAQRPAALILDEPTTFLDLKHQTTIYSLLRALARDGMLILTVTHDLNLAARYATHVLLLNNGSMSAYGSPAAVLTEPAIAATFGVDCRILDGGPQGRWITYG